MGKVIGLAASVAGMVVMAMNPGMGWAIAVGMGLTAASTVYGTVQQKRQAAKAKAKARKQYNDSLEDRAITVVNTVMPKTYVYGRARVGSNVVAVFTSGNKDQYKHLVCVHAAHECDAFEDIWIASKKLWSLDADGFVTGGDYYKAKTENSGWETYNSYTFTLPNTPKAGSLVIVDANGDDVSYALNGNTVAINSIGTVRPIGGGAPITIYPPPPFSVNYQYIKNTSTVRVQRHLGTANDPVDPYLNGLFPDKWPKTSVLRGYCYTVVTLDLNQAEFQGGIPDIEVLLRGKRLYDPRTSATNWGQNNALVIYDYLRSEMCGVSQDDIPLAPLIAAANVCEEQFSFGARYTFNGTVSSDSEPQSILEQMAQSMAGSIVATTWDITAGKYTAPVMAIQSEDIVGKLSITPGLSENDIYNGVHGQYISPENDYVLTDIKPYQNTAFVSADGKELWTDISFQYTDNLQRAHNLCRIFMEDQRDTYTVRGEFAMRTWPLKVGQRVTLTNEFFGWDAKVFRVTEKKFSPSTFVELTLKEDGPEIWDFADAVTPDQIPNSDLANPFYVETPKIISAESGTNILVMQSDGTITSRVLLTWSVDNADYVEIEFSSKNNGWQQINALAESGSAYLVPVEDGELYTIRIRGAKAFVNAKSDWAYTYHTVLGKTEPPTDVPWFLIDGNTLSWGQIADIDLAGYEIRYHFSDRESWGDANQMHTGLLTSSPYTPDAMPTGAVTLMIKAVDTTGNYSLNARYIRTQLGDAAVRNVLEIYDFQADGYPGTIIGGAVSGGMIRANGSSVFYGNDGAYFYGADNSDEFYSDNYAELIYTTSAITPTRFSNGSQMTLNTEIFGGAIKIEFSASGGEDFYGNDVAPFYGPDDSLFYGSNANWQIWPGAVAVENGTAYQFRFAIEQGAAQGIINTCQAVIDVPDIDEVINDFIVPAGGARLPLNKEYNVIKIVNITLQDDGSGAVSAKRIDYRIEGPLIICYDADGVSVRGVIDARVQGY